MLKPCRDRVTKTATKQKRLIIDDYQSSYVPQTVGKPTNLKTLLSLLLIGFNALFTAF